MSPGDSLCEGKGDIGFGHAHWTILSRMRSWLMKSEPDCYGIDDLEREGVGMWEGCRNYAVRNFLRDSMAVGDRAFFYHSNAAPTGIVGWMEVASEAYPDPTQFDPKSEYFDPKATPESPRWYARDMRFRERFRGVVTLAQLKATPGLEDMAVTKKGQMLSITPVTDAEWEIVMGLASG
ncbi:MAG: EVE domain-containing protein [Fimbriimonadaceae bacterium]|nr:MAG: EVE domain-containing protein [Fimbriimonadaceae bacterium]